MIAALHKKHGDEADERDDYQALEDRRWGAINVLTTVRAQSFVGLRAKAEALKTRSIVEDYDATGDIAASLAADILTTPTA